MSDVTRILSQIDAGDPHAAEQLLPLVYDELRKLAAAKLAHEKPGQTLQATALVHEAYLRLVGKQEPSARDQGPAGRDTNPDDQNLAPGFHSRGHFFAAAAEAMRRILVEQARRKSRVKHGGGQIRVDFHEAEIACQVPDDELIALDEALANLAAEEPLKARLVELRFFVGMTNEEAADLLGISAVTAKRYWRYARAWLHRQVSGQADLGKSSSISSKNLPGG
ncbi:MAG TPA: ECF-type sigma factor [Pirellulaceae bacterium]|jgi:RNA polymerase sigma factor (sigma-70 family)|nr:ECF-type sigma factor [Pirellulaceae bacterium]